MRNTAAGAIEGNEIRVMCIVVSEVGARVQSKR